MSSREYDLDTMTINSLERYEPVTAGDVNAVVHGDELRVWITGDIVDPTVRELRTPMGKLMVAYLHPNTGAGLGIAFDTRDESVPVGWLSLASLADLDDLDGGVPSEWSR